MYDSNNDDGKNDETRGLDIWSLKWVGNKREAIITTKEWWESMLFFMSNIIDVNNRAGTKFFYLLIFTTDIVRVWSWEQREFFNYATPLVIMSSLYMHQLVKSIVNWNI